MTATSNLTKVCLSSQYVSKPFESTVWFQEWVSTVFGEGEYEEGGFTCLAGFTIIRIYKTNDIVSTESELSWSPELQCVCTVIASSNQLKFIWSIPHYEEQTSNDV